MVRVGTAGWFLISGLSIPGYGRPRDIRISRSGEDYGWIESHHVTGYERRSLEN